LVEDSKQKLNTESRRNDQPAAASVHIDRVVAGSTGLRVGLTMYLSTTRKYGRAKAESAAATPKAARNP
jgi:hypothetical protein